MDRDTPCVGLCSTLYDPVCRGCGRTQLEVDTWVFMTEEEKAVVWARLEQQGLSRKDAPGRATGNPDET